MHVVVSHELPWIYINVIVTKIYFCELEGIAEKQRGIKGCTHTFCFILIFVRYYPSHVSERAKSVW